jgi:hypothetical protein
MRERRDKVRRNGRLQLRHTKPGRNDARPRSSTTHVRSSIRYFPATLSGPAYPSLGACGPAHPAAPELSTNGEVCQSHPSLEID